MVYNNNYGNIEPGDLAYDLRQAYAQILGEHLIDATTNRKENKFYQWFKALEDIKTITKHKFKKKEEALKEYEKLIKKIKEIAKKNSLTWSGQISDPDQIQEIDMVLRELEEFLYERMEESKLFGEGGRQASF